MLESGIILINKPKGISSNKVVNIVKATLHAKKCGHLGTLDLEGEGLLPITVNSATKLFDYFLKKDKTYEANFVFGYETDTLDTSGKIVKAKEVNFTEVELEEAVKSMIGRYEQMPPMYSAKKVGGKVAYVEARKGQEVNLSPKEVEITSFKILGKVGENTYRFEITCSSGTYIRSIARDLAYHLGTYGSMQCILRTRCGVFCLKEAYSLDEIESGNFKVIPCDSVFNLPKISLSEKENFKILNGQILDISEKDGEYKLYFGEKFLGIGEVMSAKLKMKLNLT